MIVRISGHGQYELNDSSAKRLEDLDQSITAALRDKDASRFHSLLQEAVAYIEQNGTSVAHNRVVPSDLIVPPADISLEQAHSYFTDDTHLEPMPA